MTDQPTLLDGWTGVLFTKFCPLCPPNIIIFIAANLKAPQNLSRCLQTSGADSCGEDAGQVSFYEGPKGDINGPVTPEPDKSSRFSSP